MYRWWLYPNPRPRGMEVPTSFQAGPRTSALGCSQGQLTKPNSCIRPVAATLGPFLGSRIPVLESPATLS